MMYSHRSLLYADTYNDTCYFSNNCETSLHPPPPPLFDDSNPNPNPSLPAPPPTPSRSHGLSNSLLLAASLLAAAVLLALTFFAVIRRRRRRQLLSPSPRAAGTLGPAGSDDDDDDDGGGGGAEPLHHAWYVRTVGLDDATIASIPVAAHRGGGGDCSVCLGEFRDGELVRLLPKCAHPFHLSCIDTWLRAHVSCPLCRSLVVDPSTAADPPIASIPTPIAAAAAAAESDPTQSDPDDEEASQEEEVVVEEIENRATIVDPESDSPNSPLPGSEPVPQAPIDPVIGRSVSMDSPHVAVSVPPELEESELNPQEDQIVIKEKEKDLQANLSKAPATSDHLDIERSLSSSGRGFFFSRHGRARSSILPL
ncbi:RING-H2 finger protein ATL52 [Ananas comosus]|uniref:RING-type E3 ubiquitin transferase n=1 Tax=Ananas comosus TaxID=4615 RepID=A0A199VG65_ANACO|nr:RING-H2 finger protein ATL52 [Ananas comosus]